MNKADKKKANAPKNQPKLFVIKVTNVLDHSEVKLHIPKDDNGRATLDKKWYVWFNQKNPTTGKYDNRSKFKRTFGINRYKSVALRKKAGMHIVGALTQMLNEGFNHYTNTIEGTGGIQFELNNATIGQAIEQALEDKKDDWSETTIKSGEYRVNAFLKFATRHKFIELPAQEFKRAHVAEFLKQLSRQGQGATSVNNYRNILSGVVSQMVENGHVEHNFIFGIKKKKSRPVRNHPYTAAQIRDIKKYLLKYNPELLKYIRVMAYSFLRNREVMRLRVKDVDLKNRLLSVKTKGNDLEKVYMVDQLVSIFKAMNLKQHSPNDFIFTRHGGPGAWDAALKTKTKVMSDQYRDVKKYFGLGREYTIYSFRHSFALNIYDNYTRAGLSDMEAMMKMLPITRHKTLKALSEYLRDKKRMLPKNYGHNITIDL